MALLFLASISTIIASFARVNQVGPAVDSAAGVFYYLWPKEVIVEVREPVHQLMRVRRDEIAIYYPERARAFSITSKAPFSLPFGEIFYAMAKDACGMPAMGHVLRDSYEVGDTLYTIWVAKGTSGDKVPTFVVGEHAGRVIYFKITTPENGASSESRFSDFVEYEGKFFPQMVQTVASGPGGGGLETLHFDSLRFNDSVPAQLREFAVPDSVKVEKSEW